MNIEKTKKVLVELPYEVNEQLETYCKEQERKTGVKPSKVNAIINILKLKLS